MRGPVIRTVLVLSLLSAPTALGESLSLTIGPADVEATFNDVPACAGPAHGTPCPLGRDDGETVLPDDDTFYGYHSVDHASISLRGPMTHASDLDLDLRNIRANHTFLATLDGVLVGAEAAIPGPVGERMSTRSWDTGTYVVVRVPSLNGTSPSETEAGVPIFVFFTDRNGTRTPNGLAPNGLDSDFWVPNQLELLRLCTTPELGGANAVTCDVAPVDRLQNAWPGLTPRFILGAALNRTTFHITGLVPGDGSDGVVRFGPGGAEDGFASGPSTIPAISAAELPAVREWPRHSSTMKGTEPAPFGPRAEGDPHIVGPESTVAPWFMMVVALLMPVAWLYNRITRARCLESATRSRLLELARAQPGVLVGDAAKLLGLAYHTTWHHARMLKKCGHVETVTVGRNVAVYPVGSVALAQRASLVNLRRGPQGAALRFIHLNPGLPLAEVARRTGTNKSSAHAKLGRLLRQGLIERDRDAGYHITRSGEELLAKIDREAQRRTADVAAPAAEATFTG